MKIVHLADTHLGHTAYRKISAAGFNQREEDIVNTFHEAISRAIELRPDIVLHAGDLFDSVRPTNRILNIALQELHRLIAAGIPTVLISGNHDTPRQRSIGSVFSIIGLLNTLYPDLFYVAHEGNYQRITIVDTVIHAVPQCNTDEKFRAELIKADIVPGKRNILLGHGGIVGMKEFSYGEFNELLFDRDILDKAYDYIALGHYHGFMEINERAYYAGSTERLSFNEARQQKGFIVADFAPALKISFHEVPTRPMPELPIINAQGMDTLTLQAEIEAAVSRAIPAGKIMRLKVTEVAKSVRSTLDFTRIRELAAESLHFELMVEEKEESKMAEYVHAEKISIQDGFVDFIRRHPALSDKEKTDLAQLGLHCFMQVSSK